MGKKLGFIPLVKHKTHISVSLSVSCQTDEVSESFSLSDFSLSELIVSDSSNSCLIISLVHFCSKDVGRDYSNFHLTFISSVAGEHVTGAMSGVINPEGSCRRKVLLIFIVIVGKMTKDHLASPDKKIEIDKNDKYKIK